RHILHSINTLQITILPSCIHTLFFSFLPAPPTPQLYTFPYTTLFRSSTGCRGRRCARCRPPWPGPPVPAPGCRVHRRAGRRPRSDRKSTRVNSSHSQISYAVFCLKKKKQVHVWSSCR